MIRNASLMQQRFGPPMTMRNGIEGGYGTPADPNADYWQAVRDAGWRWDLRGRMPLPVLCCEHELAAIRLRSAIANLQVAEYAAALAALGPQRTRADDFAAYELRDRLEAKWRAMRCQISL